MGTFRIGCRVTWSAGRSPSGKPGQGSAGQALVECLAHRPAVKFARADPFGFLLGARSGPTILDVDNTDDTVLERAFAFAERLIGSYTIPIPDQITGCLVQGELLWSAAQSAQRGVRCDADADQSLRHSLDGMTNAQRSLKLKVGTMKIPSRRSWGRRHSNRIRGSDVRDLPVVGSKQVREITMLRSPQRQHKSYGLAAALGAWLPCRRHAETAEVESQFEEDRRYSGLQHQKLPVQERAGLALSRPTTNDRRASP
jgi:hypothetical protein